jgi:DNA polymerase I-like protein with 3'-5' exonuclease and polymerase domains
VDNAIRSALLGSAIGIQAAVMRQACNSPVQSTGANLTKILMGRLWHNLRTPVLNVHDELISPLGPLTADTQEEVREFLAQYRKLVPSLNIEMKPLRVWSDK